MAFVSVGMRCRCPVHNRLPLNHDHEVMAVTMSPGSHEANKRRTRFLIASAAIILGNIALVAASMTLLRGAGETTRQVLLMIASASTVAALVWTVFYVHEHRQRMAALLLSSGLLLLLTGTSLSDGLIARALPIVAIVLVLCSATVSIRAFRATSS